MVRTLHKQSQTQRDRHLRIRTCVPWGDEAQKGYWDALVGACVRSGENGGVGLRGLYKIQRGNDCFINPLTAKLFNLNFHPLEVVSR